MKKRADRKMRRFLVIFGTRPEAIKLSPLVRRLREIGKVAVCSTGQHRQMLRQVLGFFSIVPDYDLRIMGRDQTLFTVTSRALARLEGVIDDARPDLILVQGDTTTAFAGALAGFYRKIPVAHIEAGLRSFDKFSPYPEEMNRLLVSRLADYHFAPTNKARENLLSEGVSERDVFVVGNTVIDALFEGLDIIRDNDEAYRRKFRPVDFSKKVILVTGHRRESFGRPFEQICRALREIARGGVEIVYPVHLNPRVRAHVYPLLRDVANIHLIEPLDYPHLIWLMRQSYLILTDSGGIQEEAPSLGKPVLVMRDVTERTEGIDAGTAVLVGTDRGKIVAETQRLLTDSKAYRTMARRKNPYGDGRAAERIRDLLKGLP